MSRRSEVVSILKDLSPGELPMDIFNEVARLTIVPVIELIVEYQQSVLLNERPDHDIYWPGKYCLPGRIVSSKDQLGLAEQAELLYDDLNVTTEVKPYIVFSFARLVKTERGTELALVYKAKLLGHARDDTHRFFSKKSIKKMENIIPEHKQIIFESK